MKQVTKTNLNEQLRHLPGVDEVLKQPELAQMLQHLPQSFVVQAIRTALESTRSAIIAGEARDTGASALALAACALLEAELEPSLRRAINATGVIVHTNLGRSALAPSAQEAVQQVMSGYSTLEYDTAIMARGSRHAHCEQLVCALTGAEAGIAVNNNAAAVMLVLSEFAAGHSAIVSRGELIEIGGAFRIPDIMELSRAQMVEVGTTNKTHVSDYERAITDDTAMLLKVHTSNYQLIGFTETVSTQDLGKLAHKTNEDRHQRNAGTPELLVYEDLGSGAFMQLPPNSSKHEPTVAQALQKGCDLVSFSGDKLLGGPQAGIIVGSAQLIARLKKNPLVRALRLDKMTIAALEATLRLYLDPEKARTEIPTLRMLTAPSTDILTQAQRLAILLESMLEPDCAAIEVVEEIGRAGGGSLPMYDIETYAVQVSFLQGDAQSCASYLVQQCETPIIARVKHEHLLFDVRTLVNDEEFALLAQSLCNYFGKTAQ